MRLIHLFKEPSAQRHWTNLHGVLNRAQLDSRKSPAVFSEASNPLSCLAEMFNDYEEFRPQNLMVEYVSPGVNLPPIKKQPYQPSGTEWAYLANFTHDLDPCNTSRKNILRGEDWVKSTWTDCRKYLHQMFANYHRSGQHDDDVDEWGSEKELKRWTRAASWKPAGSTSIIRYTSAMIYSISILDLCDFEAIGRKMTKGNGVDATVDDGTVAPPHKTKRRRSTTTKDALKQDGIIKILELGDARDAKMSALHMFLEFESHSEKCKAKRELHVIAFGSSAAEDVNSSDDEELLRTRSRGNN